MEYRPNRRDTHVKVRMVIDDMILDALMVDISRDGARLAFPGDLAPGTAVTLKIDGAEVDPLIHWSRRGHSGVRFLDRLAPETLSMLESAADRLAGFR